MIIKRQIGEKGQIVIPIDVRKKFKFHKGVTVNIEVKDNGLLIKPEQSPEEFLKDFLDVPKLKRPVTTKQIKRIILEQYENEIPRR